MLEYLWLTVKFVAVALLLIPVFVLGELESMPVLILLNAVIFH